MRTFNKQTAVFKSASLPSVQPHDKDDFIWSLKEEPHYSRRKEILKQQPSVKKLFGVEHSTKWIILGIVAAQIATCIVFRDLQSYKSPWFWLAAYFIGGTSNQALFLGIHELSHNLGFKKASHNKLWSILVANVPIAFPYAASFKPYHMEHHRYQGVDGVDADLPTKLEGFLFSSMLGKLFFSTFQILFYALRPIMIKVHPFTAYHILNIAYIFGVDYLLYSTFGMGCLIYLWTSTMIAGSGLHPCAAHFIAEHFVFSGDAETYSYYGILNFFCFNVGYHNEHHDFPNIPWTRLPALRKLAAEHYDNLPYHESWPMVTIKFIFDPSIGVWNRVKRKHVIRETPVVTEEDQGMESKKALRK